MSRTKNAARCAAYRLRKKAGQHPSPTLRSLEARLDALEAAFHLHAHHDPRSPHQSPAIPTSDHPTQITPELRPAPDSDDPVTRCG